MKHISEIIGRPVAGLVTAMVLSLLGGCGGGGTGHGAKCGGASDCGGATPICSSGGWCVQCESQTQCGFGRVCDPNGFCVECQSDTDCPSSAPVCDTALGDCVECFSNGDCGIASPVCLRGDCVTGCDSSTSCGFGQLCGSVGTCVGCDSDVDCSAGAPLCNPLRYSCVECFSAKDCPLASPHCIEGSCRNCIQNTDCTGSGVCLPNLRCR